MITGRIWFAVSRCTGQPNLTTGPTSRTIEAARIFPDRAGSGAGPGNNAATPELSRTVIARRYDLGMTDTAAAPLRGDKAYQAGPEEVRGLIVSSPVMPQVVEGPLKLPPLTAPTPPAAAQPPANSDD